MKKFTLEQGIIVSGYTGFLAVPFDKFHEDVEKRFGHPLFTHQFSAPGMDEKIKQLYKADFLAMCTDGTQEAS